MSGETPREAEPGSAAAPPAGSGPAAAPAPSPVSSLPDDELFAALDTGIAAMLDVPVEAYDHPVPSCPGWTVTDLLTHTTRVHLWATRRATAGPDERVPFPKDELGTGASLHAAFRANATGLVDALHTVDLDRLAPTFVGAQPARWWLRRQAQETIVHAWDAAAALGTPPPIDASLAIDGIDEMLDVFFVHRFPADTFGGTGETMHLHATDPPPEMAAAGRGEWLVRFEPDGPVVTREHAKGDVAVRDQASNLLLFLWSRVAPTALTTFGDETVLERYQAAASY